MVNHQWKSLAMNIAACLVARWSLDQITLRPTNVSRPENNRTNGSAPANNIQINQCLIVISGNRKNRNRKWTTEEKSKDSPAAKTAISNQPAASQSTPQLMSPAAVSSWQVDPVLTPSNLVPGNKGNLVQLFRQHWPQIQTRFRSSPFLSYLKK